MDRGSFRRTMIVGVWLVVVVSGMSAPPGIFHTPEPPMAGTNGAIVDPEVKQASGQYPVNANTAPVGAYPMVTVTIVAPPVVPHGKDLEYKLRVDNPSNQPANEVQVIHPLPKGARLVKADPPSTPSNDDLVWNLGTMAAGSRKEISLTVSPPPGAGEWNHSARVRFDYTRQAKTKIARPELSLRLLTLKDVQQFDIITMRLEVMNPGLMEVKDVQVNMQLPDGMPAEVEPPIPGRPPTSNDPKTRHWTIPKLGPNEVRTYDVRTTAKGLGAHSVITQAISGAGAKSENKTEILVQAPKLEVTASAPSQRSANQTSACRITVRNNGPHLMRNVTVADKVGPGTTIVAASDAAQIFDRDVQWIIPLLQPGETRIVELTVKNPTGGKATHSVSASYRGFRQSTEAATDFAALAELRVDFRGSPDVVEVGGTLRYQVTVENTGAAPATNVRAALTLPDSLAFVSAEPPSKQDGDRVLFESVTVPAGGRQVFAVTVRGARPAVNSVTSVEVRADVLEAGPLRRQETTTITTSK